MTIVAIENTRHDYSATCGCESTMYRAIGRPELALASDLWGTGVSLHMLTVADLTAAEYREAVSYYATAAARDAAVKAALTGPLDWQASREDAPAHFAAIRTAHADALAVSWRRNAPPEIVAAYDARMAAVAEDAASGRDTDARS